jgi:hypothetical protein
MHGGIQINEHSLITPVTPVTLFPVSQAAVTSSGAHASYIFPIAFNDQLFAFCHEFTISLSLLLGCLTPSYRLGIMLPFVGGLPQVVALQ